MSFKKELTKHRGKALLSLKILDKRYHIGKKHLFIPLLFTVLFMVNQKYFIIGLMTIVAGVFAFYHDKYNRTPIDFKLPLFLGIVISYYYGFVFAVIFYLLGDLIPSLLGGGELEAASFMFMGWTWIIYGLVHLFPDIGLIPMGVILVIIETIGSVFITMTRGFPGTVALISSLLTTLARIGYFMTLGPVIEIIFSLIGA